ncbi:hypothetical protein ACVWW5_000595 [Bradyrhizobium sp. LM3.4]
MQDIARFDGRAAKHVGEDRDAVAGIDAVNRFYDVASTEIGIIFGADRDRFDLLLWAHDMFKRCLEFVGKAPVGHKY